MKDSHPGHHKQTQSEACFRLIQDTIQNDFLSLQIPKRDFLIEPILYHGQNAMVYAKAGVGKTTFCSALASAVSRGGKCFGPYRVPNASGVLYLDGEMPAIEMQDRLKKLWIQPDPARFKVISAEMLSIQCLAVPSLDDEAWRDGFLQFFRHNPDYKLFVIDNLSSLSTGDENTSLDWGAINQWLLSLRRLGLTTILVHHAGRNNEQRGTTKREDQMDLILKLTEVKNRTVTTFRVDFQKARSLSQDIKKPFIIEVMRRGDDTLLIHKGSLDDQLAEIAYLASQGWSQKDMAERFECNQGTISKRIAKARQKGWLDSNNSLTELGETYCVSMTDDDR